VLKQLFGLFPTTLTFGQQSSWNNYSVTEYHFLEDEKPLYCQDELQILLLLQPTEGSLCIHYIGSKVQFL